MITRLLVVVLACSSYLFGIQTLLPQTRALRMTPKINELMMGNLRTRTRSRLNNVIQRALGDEMSMDNLPSSANSLDLDTPEELSDQIVDYTNTIRNDIICLDKKNDALPDTPCFCKSSISNKYLGSRYIPKELDSLECADTCSKNYRCKPIYYYVTVLKMRPFSSLRNKRHYSLDDYEPIKVNVTTACVCARDYTDLN